MPIVVRPTADLKSRSVLGKLLLWQAWWFQMAVLTRRRHESSIFTPATTSTAESSMNAVATLEITRVSAQANSNRGATGRCRNRLR